MNCVNIRMHGATIEKNADVYFHLTNKYALTASDTTVILL